MNKVTKLTTAALGVAMVGSLVAPAEARNPFGNGNVQAVVQSNFATRQAQLRSEISADINAGRINPNVASSLLAQLDQINAQTQSDLAYGGGISNGEANRLNNMFTSVTQQLQNATAGAAYAYGNPYQNMYRYGNVGSPYNFRSRLGVRRGFPWY